MNMPDSPAQVVDFDHESTEYAADPLGAYHALWEGCPVPWSDAYGGFWVVSRYADVCQVARDDATFSSDHDSGGERTGYSGVIIPERKTLRAIPLELDPPELKEYRRILLPAFSRPAVEKLAPFITRFTDYSIDRYIETGEMDLVLHLASPIPAVATLRFLGLPLSHWKKYADVLHDLPSIPDRSSERARVLRSYAEIQMIVRDAIRARTERPQDDLISLILQSRPMGKAISEDDAVEMVMTLLGGGVDTTTSVLACTLEYLDRNRAARQQLIDNPDQLPVACEEFIRHFSPVQTFARTVTRGAEIGGQPVREGDRVLICWAGANHDPREFESPDDIVLDRSPNRHVSFGVGGHRCLGVHFARVEFAAVLGRILERMPDYTLRPGESQRYETISIINGFVRMPATFTPGKRVLDDDTRTMFDELGG